MTDPSYEVNPNVQATLSQLGQEIGDDLSITFDSSALTPFTKLSATLSRLHWVNGSGAATTVKRFLAAEGTVFSAGHDLSEMVGRTVDEYREIFEACCQLMLD